MYRRYKTIVAVLIVNVWLGVAAQSQGDKSLPSDFPTCRRNDPDRNTCLRHVFQDWLVRTKDGIESLGIPPIDPLQIGRLNYAYDNGVFSGVVKLKRVVVTGISVATIDRVNMEFNETFMSNEMHAYVGKINVIGNYASDIRLMQYTFTPKGTFNITIYNYTFTCTNWGDLYKRDGFTYWNLTDIYIPKPEIGDIRFNVTGLFDDPALVELSLNYVKDNWRRLLDILWPETWSMWEPYLKQEYNKFFELMPLEMLLTDD